MAVTTDYGYLLHSKDYRETSQLVDLFTRNNGRIRAVAKGAKRKRVGGGLALFQPYQISWSGAGDLKTITQWEASGPGVILLGKALYVGFYINELLLRLLPDYNPHPDMMVAYQQLIDATTIDPTPEAHLRCFEMQLLEELGYGLVLDYDAVTGQPLQADAWYSYNPLDGVIPLEKPNAVDRIQRFTGAELTTIAARQLDNPDTLKAAKNLLRGVIHHQLEGRPLNSRTLFQQYYT